ncbi:MAG: low molecular weight protein arginine phosphatase [Chloroflexi bacterium]|nr:low molecular weight protein arginine phosphatase [Chloroflexota bacterium]
MPQVLFVCSGNTCRSPVAMAVLRERLHARGIDDWLISSAGIRANAGDTAAQFSIKLMKERGIDLALHRSHVLNFEGVTSAHLILCMSQGHVHDICEQFPEQCNKTHKLSEMIGKQFDISDPYGGSLVDYHDMIFEVSRIIDEGFEKIVQLATFNANRLTR